MKRLKKNLLLFLPLIIIGILLYIYYTQEERIFRSVSLPKDYSFTWDQPFEEHFIEVSPNVSLNGLLFKAKRKKGIVFYCHGRGGNLAHPWGKVAKDFTSRGYEVFIFDYRGFGKSDGKVKDQVTLLSDSEKVYQHLLKHYHPQDFVFYGRSLGTGIATYLAMKNPSKMLILEAPYFSLLDIAIKSNPFLPRFITALLLKYPLRTDEWIRYVKCPIHLLHGTADTTIPFQSSLELKKLKEQHPIQITLFEEVTHDRIVKEELYQATLNQILK